MGLTRGQQTENAKGHRLEWVRGRKGNENPVYQGLDDFWPGAIPVDLRLCDAVVLGTQGYNPSAMKVLNSQQMQQCDREATNVYGISESVLMENAGVQVVESMDEYFGDGVPELIAVMCGKGNNGGDGFVVARHLYAAGSSVRAYLFASAVDLQGAAAENRRIAEELGVEIVEVPDAESWEKHSSYIAGFDCIVDALFGTGITGPLRGYFGSVVEAVNDSGSIVVSVDLPSGLSADSDEVFGPTVQADLTVAVAALKLCHIFPPAFEFVGELSVVDIGIPTAVIDAAGSTLELITPEECARSLKPRVADTHKGTYGHVLIVAGSPGMSGAAALAARGSLRGGSGLVTVGAPDSVSSIIAGLVVEAMVRSHASDSDGRLALAAKVELLSLAASADAIAVGPGVGTSEETQQLVREIVVESPAPIVLDADGLNAFAGDPEALREVKPPCILTPHPGELGRLLSMSTAEVQADRLAAVRLLAARSGAIVVLKGYRSLVCEPNGKVAINPTGNPGMATGGSGDVLTGLLAALIGQGLELFSAARLGTFLHGEAGDIAAERVGETSLIASDIIEALPDAFSCFDPGPGGGAA